MFEELFTDPVTLTRHRERPLAEQRHRYLVHCAGLGMALGPRRTIAAYLLAVTDRLRLATRPDDRITPAEVEAAADRWAARPTRRARAAKTLGSRKRFVTHAAHWLRFLGRWQPPDPAPRPFADRVAAFGEHMRVDRALSPTTVDARCWTAQRLLDRLCESRRMEDLTPSHVDDFLIGQVREAGLARTSVRTYAYGLRAFLRYAEARGWCCRGLAGTIRTPRVYAHEGLPSAPSWADVRRLLEASAQDAKSARDHAILLILAAYGCRAGEVARLRPEDLDWRRERIRFTRSKSFALQTYPLSRSIGDAVARYLKEGRPPSTSRHVFLRQTAPFPPLTAGALWWVVSRRLRGMGLSLRHYGPHALRHACATHLSEQGLTLKEIGDPEATRLYAKVDLVRLRQVADVEIGDLL